MNIKQLKYSADNFAYLVYSGREALVIDGGAVADILRFADTTGLVIKYIAHTHMHADHTSGTDALQNATSAEYITQKRLIRQDPIMLNGHTITVMHTPGHTTDSVCFYFDNTLVSGDTLFNCNIGKFPARNIKAYYESVRKLLRLPQETIIYAGHDYVAESVESAKCLTPDNKDFDTYLQQYTPEHVCTTLADELKVNPFLRFNTDEIINMLKAKNLPTKTEYDRWQSVMRFAHSRIGGQADRRILSDRSEGSDGSELQ